MVSLEDIRKAQQRINERGKDLCYETPILHSSRIDRLISEKVSRTIDIRFKADHLQPIGSFKIRGALNFALSLDDDTRARGLVTHSSGNHGAAVAQAGQFLGVPVAVVCPKDAPTDKVARMAYYGAEIISCEPTMASRVATCESVMNERGMTEIPPFNHVRTINGQGTLGLEILTQCPDVDAIVVAVGGCGLISGIIVSAKGVKPGVKVFGAEPSALDDTAASLREGNRRGPTNPAATSICDALRVSPPGSICWDIVSTGCDGVFTVDDSATLEAMRLVMLELKQVTEPSGSVATAALFSDEFIEMLRRDQSISQIVVVICGANIGLDSLKEYI